MNVNELELNVNVPWEEAATLRRRVAIAEQQASAAQSELHSAYRAVARWGGASRTRFDLLRA